jgi:glycosyltransferase involved in cell wall biosynthesis
LSAIAAFPARDRLRLEIFGEMDEPEVVLQQIETLGIGEIVRVHGFVPEAQLDDALDRSSLAVNLRHPTMGEASGSQLRIWSRGLASLVTRTGWYADLPPESVGFVEPDNEVADLQRHFQEALDNPDVLRSMGDAGRRHLAARHSPERYANEMADVIGRMMRIPASIVAEVTGVVSRAMTECGLSGATKTAAAHRTAAELCRWVADDTGEAPRLS